LAAVLLIASGSCAQAFATWASCFTKSMAVLKAILCNLTSLYGKHWFTQRLGATGNGGEGAISMQHQFPIRKSNPFVTFGRATFILYSFNSYSLKLLLLECYI